MAEFLKSWKFAFAVFVVLAVAAVVGVVYGVTTHEEAGFMEETPHWRPSDFPLSVCVVSYVHTAGMTDVNDEARHATQVVGLINDRLGFQAYIIALPARDAIDHCEVVIEYDAPSEDGMEPGGYADIGDHACHVGLVNSVGELRSLVLQHELGHCLGLAHDDSQTSIMRPVQRPTQLGQYPAQISDSDRQLIRDTYLAP